MAFDYPLLQDIDLFVQGRISQNDALRQTLTAKAILQRLKQQPGIILADEVGMGKTYVALAVALSVALHDHEHRPVIIMVPPALQDKWPRDFDVFCQKCLPEHLGNSLTCGKATRAVEFFKLIDDPPAQRSRIIFLTHGAMTRQLHDPWIKLALIQRALYRRHNTEALRRRLARDLGSLLQKKNVDHHYPELLSELLDKPTTRWLKIMRKHGFEPEDQDDPIPHAAVEAMADMDLSEVYELLQDLPQRKSKKYELRITMVRQSLNKALRSLWASLIISTRMKLPLLIMDEAHHLKNKRTKLSSLFFIEEAEEDATEVQRGPLGGVFERMMFLTATPFQLGHHELCSVLERFSGIDWQSDCAPGDGVTGFQQQLSGLHKALDESQEAALRLDRSWGVLTREDLVVDEQPFRNTSDWWQQVSGKSHLTEIGDEVRVAYTQVQTKMAHAEEQLRPWVIRHLRSRQLPTPFVDVARRHRLSGMAVLHHQTSAKTELSGIPVADDALLPFLLAARLSAKMPGQRPIFAEGLASSYEAFLYTREMNQKANAHEFLTDEDDNATAIHIDDKDWHLNQLVRLIPQSDTTTPFVHPKVSASVDLAIELWQAGEKVLIFSHYIATGRVLRNLISERIAGHIRETAAKKLNIEVETVDAELGLIGDRFFDVD